MREIDWDKIVIYAVGLVSGILSVPLCRHLPRTRGRNWLYQILFVVLAAVALFLLPAAIQNEIFSPGGVLVIGTLLPVYESVVALCTPGETDDTMWLQYWVISGALSYTTEFMDEIRQVLPQAGEHWYEFEFFLTLWLLFPLTDGAALFYEKITAPYLAPIALKVQTKAEGYIQWLLALVNTSYIWILWFTFTSLPEEARRFVVVAVGTIYPMAASIVAMTTSTTMTLDQKKLKAQAVIYWLTYWSSYSLLFVAMDYIENFIGHIRGFYSLCLVATVYLFLPMFGGAEIVFRRILVPLSGQYENMLLHDAYLVRRGMEQSIPTDMHKDVFSKAAGIFIVGAPDEKKDK